MKNNGGLNSKNLLSNLFFDRRKDVPRLMHHHIVPSLLIKLPMNTALISIKYLGDLIRKRHKILSQKKP